MRLVGTQEWIVIGVLIAYLAFTPGFPMVRQFLSTGLGKAIGLAAIVAVWKYGSHPVALLLLVNFVRCSGMREYLENPTPGAAGAAPPNTHCPENYSFDNGQCKNKTTGQSIPATVCLPGQTWDGTKCAGSSAAAAPTPAPEVMPPPSTSSTAMKQPFTNLTPAMIGGVQPSMRDDKYAPA